MRPRPILFVLILFGIATLGSCGQEGPAELAAPERHMGEARLFEDLSDKDDVLTNLQLSYDTGDQTQFVWLVDQSFVFSFSDRDIQNGDTPEQWDRSAELQVLPNMFGSPTPTGIQTAQQQGRLLPTAAAFEERTWGYVKYYFHVNAWDSVSNMSVTLTYAAGDVHWMPFMDPGTGETWYEKEADYELTVETIGGRQFESLGGHATFAVREIPGLGIWRLVRWSDDASVFEDLTQKDDVLYNLEWSYNQRNLAEFNQLIDDDFIFFFSATDYSQGYTPEMWHRAPELAATSHMFDPNFSSPGVYPITSIDLSLTYPPGNWIAVIPPGYPGETWYEKTVIYNFIVQTASLTYIATNTEMTATVRFTEAGADSIWRLVTWRDDTGPGMAADGIGSFASAAAEEMTWGHLKALYVE